MVERLFGAALLLRFGVTEADVFGREVYGRTNRLLGLLKPRLNSSEDMFEHNHDCEISKFRLTLLTIVLK